MDHPQRFQEGLQQELQEGLRLHGPGWLQRRVKSLRVPSLLGVASSFKINFAEGVRKDEMGKALIKRIECRAPLFDLRCVVVKEGPEALRERLGRFRVVDLRQMVEEIGMPGGGLKGQLIMKLFDHISSQDCVTRVESNWSEKWFLM
eukprot:Skav202676  [mRNA]  locus=scaffold1791:598132:598572:- [translate_table: standard]